MESDYSSSEVEGERKSRWFQLSEVQQDELRTMRKRHRTENKQKKILKREHEMVNYCILIIQVLMYTNNVLYSEQHLDSIP